MSFEGMPRPVRRNESGPEGPEAGFVETMAQMRERTETGHMALVAEGLKAREAIAVLPEGAEADALRARVQERTTEAHERLKGALAAAVAALALNAAIPKDAEAGPHHADAVAAALADDPNLTQTLLEGVLVAARTRPDVPESFVQETSTTLQKLQEPHGSKYGKLAMSLAEIGARTLATAAGLGLGVGAYDALKEIVKTVRSSGS